MDDLVVDSHLETVVVDDKDADGATAIVERLGKTLRETALVKDGEALLDVASLGHGNNAAVLANVENAVLLEDRAEHVLDHDRGGGVGDEARLLVQLLGEQVNTEVAVLASLRRGGDADDLARAALEDQEVANADVVAGDGDGVSGSHLACGRGSGRNVRGGGVGSDCGAGPLDRSSGRDGAAGERSGGGRDVRGSCVRGSGGSRDVRRSTGCVLLLDDDLFLVVGVLASGVRVGVVVVVVAVRVDGVGYTLSDLVGDLVCGVVGGVTERVVLTFVVVVSHGQAVTLRGLGGGTSRRLYSNLRIASVDGVLVLGSEGLAGVTRARVVDDGAGTLTVLTLGNVNLGGRVVGGRAVDSVEVPVVGAVLDVDVGVGVRRLGREAVGRREGQLWAGKRR